MTNKFDYNNVDNAWCPGCGNFPILKLMKEALDELNIDTQKLVLVSGIGQAAKAPQYMNVHYFNGLHGRSIPPATAIKAVNPQLTVIAESGDGDMYGEGGNHFIHAIRRNPDITVIVHDNMVYGLTKGQASPTSSPGFKTPVQVDGVISQPFNPLAVAISLDASFVARAYCGDAPQTKELIKKAVNHKGFALVDIFQPCVTFNKVNTYQWFKENTYYLEEGYNPENRQEAFKRATETGKLGLGVFYVSKNKKTFEENIPAYKNDAVPVIDRQVDVLKKVSDILRSK
ncbi:MAG: thiamine pyrophosphate-dependent enzyme [Elusimicrobiota bacterium]